MSFIAQQLSQKFSYECTIGKYVENVNVVIFCLVQVENLEELKLPSILWQMFHYIYSTCYHSFVPKRHKNCL